MSVHYRFKSTLEYDTITIDGLHISVKDLKNSIIQQKRIGKSTDFDLRITNAQTQEVYDDENALIPKNTSLLIARVPITAPKQKQWEGYGGNDTPPAKVDEGGPVGKAMDLASLDAPEDDKIKAMMSQSTQDYDPSNYVKIRGANQVGPVPASYRCYKCYQTGHWIKDCPLGQGTDPVEIKKSTGIPHSFLVPVEGPQVPGAMMMANGQYAVSALDLQAYNQKSAGPTPVQEPKPEIPEDLVCSICSDLLADAVMIPCCGNSFCDECIRSFLLDSEEHECPDCHEKDISPATLIPNRFLRKSVANFKNTTGYEKKPVFKPKPDIPKEEPPKKEVTPPPVVDAKENLKEEEKTVISEADSTEHDKNGFSKDIELDPPKSKSEDPDGPPGVSPGDSSPVHKTSSKISKKDKEKSRVKERSRETEHRTHKSRRSRSASPRKPRSRRSPSFESRRISDRRSNTPTRDEPPGIGNTYVPPVNQYPGQHGTNIPPPGMPPLQGHPVPMQPTGFPPNQPPPYHPSGVPPNFRLPPPGSQPPPFMPPGYQGARPVFDPMVGPPGSFPNNYGARRDYGRRGRERTPPGVIDDPLAAFNRILREKDEKRARQQRLAARRSSWSRSRSRSRSFSRSPPPLRRRSRSPRRRKSRSRSRSFSISRSRSRSYSKSPRGSPLPSLRRSPLPQARRGASGRFRSPIRSPPSRRRIDRNDYDRDYDRGGFREKTRSRRGDSRDRYFEDRDHHRDYDRGRNRPAPVVPVPQSQPQQQWTGPRDNYYPPPQDQPGQGYQQQNRFPQQIHRIQPERKYPEITAPPVVEQPPIPGLETELPPVNEFEKKRSPERKEKEKEKHTSSKEVDKDRRSHRERKKEAKPRSRSRTKTPEKWRNPSPRGTTPEKPRKTPEKPRKRHASTEPKKRDPSEDDKRKSKDKKKHREKKDDKKKKKDKKEKHHKSKKEKKDEFRQVIPKGTESNDEELSESAKKKLEEKRKLREEEELKRIAEERKKEERRLRFIEDEKLKREELLKKEEAKRKAIEEARKLLEEEEERQKLEAKKQQEKEELELLEQQEKKPLDLYDEVIPEKDLATEIQDFNIDQKETVAEETPAVKMEQQELMPQEVKTAEEEKLFDESVNKAIIEEEDLGILELHSDMDIKLDDTDILAPLPEKSKWEEDEDGQTQINTPENKEPSDSKSKVSNEVLKRAENVIFARAINSIRPIEIKKSGSERSKIYFEEKEDNKKEVPKKEVPPVEKPKLSIKQRLGIKVDDPDPKVSLIERTPSPFNRRRIVIETSNKRHSRSNHRDRERHRNDKSSDKTSRRSRTEDKEKRKRTPSRSGSDDHKRKKKDKKVKKEKPKKEDTKKPEVEEKPKAIEKRKPTLDEANFEPDYDDLEIHEDASEVEKDKKAKEVQKTESDESSSSDSSSSSSEEERRRKKRKSKKKRKRKDSTSSDSDSSSESSDSDRDRKRRKHKKTNKKKKKKSKHK